MAEHTDHSVDSAPYTCGVESVWYVEQRLVKGSTSRESLSETLGSPGAGPDLSLQKIKHFLEESSGLWTAAVTSPLSRLDACFEQMICIVHCKGASASEGHFIALEKDGSDYVVADMGRIVRFPSLAGERKQLDALADKWEMTGTTLLVARAPMEMPHSPNVTLGAIAGIVVVIGIALLLLFRQRRFTARGN